jgi:hypothetical protein
MELQTNAISAQTDDTEANMRRNLGMNSPSRSDDPLKAARQTIRSQVAAREYTERQLVQAQATIQDLRTRSHHFRQEKDAAVGAAYSAIAAKDAAERTVKAAEAAVTAQRAARDRSDRALLEAEATIRDLRAKLATAHQALQAAQAELAAERQARPKAIEASPTAIMAPESTAPTDREEAAVPKVRRSVGRPRKLAATSEVIAPTHPEEVAVAKVRRPVGRPRKLAATSEVVAPTRPEEVAVAKVRRPVGRPRKLASGVPGRQPAVVTNNVDRSKAAKPVSPARPVEIGVSEPVQWWVAGWRER